MHTFTQTLTYIMDAFFHRNIHVLSKARFAGRFGKVLWLLSTTLYCFSFINKVFHTQHTCNRCKIVTSKKNIYIHFYIHTWLIMDIFFQIHFCFKGRYHTYIITPTFVDTKKILLFLIAPHRPRLLLRLRAFRKIPLHTAFGRCSLQPFWKRKQKKTSRNAC